MRLVHTNCLVCVFLVRHTGRDTREGTPHDESGEGVGTSRICITIDELLQEAINELFNTIHALVLTNPVSLDTTAGIIPS